MNSRPILVVSYGGPYGHYVVEILRSLQLPCFAMEAGSLSIPRLLVERPGAVILAASPLGHRPAVPRGLLRLRLPTLGICNGAQLIARHYGGELGTLQSGEFGWQRIEVVCNGQLLCPDAIQTVVWMHHSDVITSLPRGFRVLARTSESPIAAFEDTSRLLFGVQFHPELPEGIGSRIVLARFARIVGYDI